MLSRATASFPLKARRESRSRPAIGNGESTQGSRHPDRCEPASRRNLDRGDRPSPSQEPCDNQQVCFGRLEAARKVQMKVEGQMKRVYLNPTEGKGRGSA